MSVWLTIPSARPIAEVTVTMSKWREQGYKIALAIDTARAASYTGHLQTGDLGMFVDPYPGYSVAVNGLIKNVMEVDPEAEWFIAAGDDTLPDPNHTAEEIAEQTCAHFRRFNLIPGEGERSWGATFGVMQPTGDRWGDHHGAYIDRVAGSAWIGREFVRHTYGGKGPMWPEYFHMFNDEELQHVAIKLGVFWQRGDLTHLHQHWGRPREGERLAPRTRMPEFLERANSVENWQRMKGIFEARKAAGFPGHEVTG